MSWSFNTGCRYHTQDTGYYCGAACAMMVLAEIGVPYGDLDQDDLYTSNHDHNAQSGWFTDPIGLQYTLRNLKPASFHNTFVAYKLATEAAGTQKIVDTLRIYRVSPCVLVYHCQHWIVVRGVQTDVDPSNGSYTVEGLWVNNPVYENNEPHSGADVCGSGSGHGVENQWISYTTWQDTYLTGCAYDSTDGSPQYIAVCDPAKPKVGLPRREDPVRYFSGAKLAPAKAALASAAKDLQRFNLGKAKELAGFRRGQLQAPLLVQRLDEPDKHYYLSPSMVGGKIAGFAQIDARYGDLQSVFSLKRAKAMTLDVAAVEEELVGRKIELPGEAGRIRLVARKFKLAKRLVWRPCRESWSPHLPFWEISVGRSVVGYQRLDGVVFSKLTFDGRGT